MGGPDFFGRIFVLVVVALWVGIALSIVEPAFANGVPVPAPLVGAGLPALAILGGGYWLIRKIRQRRYRD